MGFGTTKQREKFVLSHLISYSFFISFTFARSHKFQLFETSSYFTMRKFILPRSFIARSYTLDGSGSKIDNRVYYLEAPREISSVFGETVHEILQHRNDEIYACVVIIYNNGIIYNNSKHKFVCLFFRCFSTGKPQKNFFFIFQYKCLQICKKKIELKHYNTTLKKYF